MARFDRPIALTDDERAAVMEIGLRPTFSIERGVDDAAFLASAERITLAGEAGLLPSDLHAEFAGLLREAIHETRHELWAEQRGRDLWRIGLEDYRLPGVPEEDHERRYAEQIDLCAQLSAAFTSLALKLDAW